MPAEKKLARRRRVPTVLVSFACNDYRNGNLGESVENVHLDDEEIQLVGRSLTYREHDRDGKVQVGRRRFAHEGITPWLGNWCWNGARMQVPEARRLVAYLLERGWSAEQWPTKGPWADLFDEHGRARKVTPEVTTTEEK